MKHTDNQYIEEQIILLVDGELAPEQEKIIREIIKGNPEYQDLYHTYLSVQLEPDTDITCTFKEALKKPETIAFLPPVKRKSRWPLYAAAALAPIAIISAIWLGNQANHTQTEGSIVKSQLPPSFNIPVPATGTTSSSPKSKVKTTVPKRIAHQPGIKNAPDPGTLAQTKPEQPVPEARKAIYLIGSETADIQIAAVHSSPINPIAENVLPANEALTKELAGLSHDAMPKGLLGDVIKAGNWILNEKKSTTVELSLGNLIHKSYNITLK